MNRTAPAPLSADPSLWDIIPQPGRNSHRDDVSFRLLGMRSPERLTIDTGPHYETGEMQYQMFFTALGRRPGDPRLTRLTVSHGLSAASTQRFLTDPQAALVKMRQEFNRIYGTA